MKLTVTRGELKDAVQGFAKIIPAGKPILSILGCVRFAIDSGDLKAQATDLDQTAVFRFDNAEAEGEGVIIVPFQLLRDLSKGTGTETVTLQNEGADIAVTNNVGGHAITRTVACTDDADWPASGAAITTAPAKGFMQAYRRMAPFTSSDDTRRTLQCVHVDVSGEGEHNATLVACDGRRLTCCNSMRLPIDDEHGVMVPVTKFLLWNGLADEADIGMSKTKECTRFGIKSGQWMYRVKAVEGEYPNWRQVVPCKDGMEHRLVFTDSDVEALRKILPNFPGDEAVSLDGAKNGTLSISGTDKDSGRVLTVPLTAGSSYKGVGCRFIANRNYLLDALNAGFRNFMFADGASPLLSEDGKGGTHVLMPLRLEGPPRPAQAGQQTAPAAQAGTGTSTQTPVAAKPPPEQPKEKTAMKKETTTQPVQQSQEHTALEKLQAVYEQAKNKLREMQVLVQEVGQALKEAAKEERKRSEEVAAVRVGLAKIQSLKV